MKTRNGCPVRIECCHDVIPPHFLIDKVLLIGPIDFHLTACVAFIQSKTTVICLTELLGNTQSIPNYLNNIQLNASADYLLIIFAQLSFECVITTFVWFIHIVLLNILHLIWLFWFVTILHLCVYFGQKTWHTANIYFLFISYINTFATCIIRSSSVAFDIINYIREMMVTLFVTCCL